MTTIDCDLCIIGAGYAALNGLNAAAKYLPAGAHVVVIDRNATWGGQWLHQYDFVRLHQPYSRFTAGDQKWRMEVDAAHLATRGEVLAHLGTVPAVSAGHLRITPLFAHEHVAHAAREGAVDVDVTPCAEGGTPVRVRAKRLLFGTGIDIHMLPPLALTSKRVRSVAVTDPVLASAELRESPAPVYVIGSGKTAMDTARHLLATRAGRPVRVITGSGMWFFHRENCYPRGLARWTRGQTAGDLFQAMAEQFDGSNEAAVFDTFARAGWVHNVFGLGGNCRYALLSAEERTDILAGLDEVVRGHLVDVDGLRMTWREGGETRETPVPEGTWFVNCTTHFRVVPHRPLLSDDGLVCAPQYALGFSGSSAYFLTHLWYRDALARVAAEMSRVAVDLEPKLRFAPQLAVMVMGNIARVAEKAPPSLFAKFEGDYGKWYPLPRQLTTLARLRLARAALIRKSERLLPLRFSDAPAA